MSDVAHRSGALGLFFENKTSVAIILVACVAFTCLIPGVGALLPIIASLVALLAARKSGSAALLGFRRPDSWLRLILTGAGIGFLLQVLFHSLLDPLFERLTGTVLDLTELESMQGDPVKFAIWLTIGWIVGGFLEELAFRGYIITRAQHLFGENARGATLAVFVSVIPFGVAHLYQDWAGVLSTGLAGLAFALVYLRSGRNLWLTMLVHGFMNTTDITLIFLGYTRAFRLI